MANTVDWDNEFISASSNTAIVTEEKDKLDRQLVSKKDKKEMIQNNRENSQENPKQKYEIYNSEHYISGYASLEFTRDETYRSVTQGTKYTQDNKTSYVWGPSSRARQIEERPETYASLRLIKNVLAKSTTFRMAERETNVIPPFTRFFLQQTSFVNQEKFQIVETFGDFKVLFYGKRPVIKQYSGYLLNTQNHNWMTDFEFVYENYLRGTQSVKYNALAYLTFDNVIIEGYIIMASFNRTALDPNGIPFSFQMVITDKVPIDLSGTQFRNRVIEDKRSLNEIKENQKMLPPTAVNVLRNFFDTGAVTGVVAPVKKFNSMAY